eukprot:scaffold110088_cov22-Tisochrysis_lutea.AAC.2
MPVGDMWLLRWSSADGEVRGMRTQVHGRAGSGLYSPICTDPFLKAEDDENKGADGGADDGAAAAADGILAAESLVLCASFCVASSVGTLRTHRSSLTSCASRPPNTTTL